jgi:hypothetical protein
MDAGTSWSDLPDELVQAILAEWPLICAEWDRLYPTNPVNDPEQE